MSLMKCQSCKKEHDPGQEVYVLFCTEITADGMPYPCWNPQAAHPGKELIEIPQNNNYFCMTFCDVGCLAKYAAASLKGKSE